MVLDFHRTGQLPVPRHSSWFDPNVFCMPELLPVLSWMICSTGGWSRWPEHGNCSNLHKHLASSQQKPHTTSYLQCHTTYIRNIQRQIEQSGAMEHEVEAHTNSTITTIRKRKYKNRKPTLSLWTPPFHSCQPMCTFQMFQLGMCKPPALAILIYKKQVCAARKHK